MNLPNACLPRGDRSSARERHRQFGAAQAVVPGHYSPTSCNAVATKPAERNMPCARKRSMTGRAFDIQPRRLAMSTTPIVPRVRTPRCAGALPRRLVVENGNPSRIPATMGKYLGFTGTQIPGSHRVRNGHVRDKGKPRIAVYPRGDFGAAIAGFDFEPPAEPEWGARRAARPNRGPRRPPEKSVAKR